MWQLQWQLPLWVGSSESQGAKTERPRALTLYKLYLDSKEPTF